MNNRRLLIVVVCVVAIAGLVVYFYKKSTGTGAKSGFAGSQGLTNTMVNGISVLEAEKLAFQADSEAVNKRAFNDLIGAAYFDVSKLWDFVKLAFGVGIKSSEEVRREFYESIKPKLFQAAVQGDERARSIVWGYWPDEARAAGIRFAGLFDTLSEADQVLAMANISGPKAHATGGAKPKTNSVTVGKGDSK